MPRPGVLSGATWAAVPLGSTVVTTGPVAAPPAVAAGAAGAAVASEGPAVAGADAVASVAGGVAAGAAAVAGAGTAAVASTGASGSRLAVVVGFCSTVLAPLPSRGTSMASGWPVFSAGRPATSFFGSATTTTTTSADTTALRPGSCDDRLSSWLPGGSCWSEA